MENQIDSTIVHNWYQALIKLLEGFSKKIKQVGHDLSNEEFASFGTTVESQLYQGDDSELLAVLRLLVVDTTLAPLSARDLWCYERCDRPSIIGLYNYGTLVKAL